MTDEKPIDQRGKLAPGAGTDDGGARRASSLAAEPFDIQVTRDKVLVRFRGRLVRTLTGADVDEVRAAVAEGDPEAVQLLIARKTGNFKRGNEGGRR